MANDTVSWLVTIALAMLTGSVLLLFVGQGISLLRLVLGKDRCFGSAAYEGCGTWIYGTLLCGVVAHRAWPAYGLGAVGVAMIVPVLATLFWTLVFLLRAREVRRREFQVQDGVIVLNRNGVRVDPEYVILGRQCNQTGISTAFETTVLELGNQKGVIARNVYIDKDAAERELAGVMACEGRNICRRLDLAFVARPEADVMHSVYFSSPAWTPLLCGRLEKLTDADRVWWRQWCQPDFGVMGHVTIDCRIIYEHAERLVEAYPEIAEQHPSDSDQHDQMPLLNAFWGLARTRNNLVALQALLDRNTQVEIMTARKFHEEVECMRNGRCVGGSCDEWGVDINKVEHFDRQGPAKRA